MTVLPGPPFCSAVEKRQSPGDEQERPDGIDSECNAGHQALPPRLLAPGPIRAATARTRATAGALAIADDQGTIGSIGSNGERAQASAPPAAIETHARLTELPDSDRVGVASIVSSVRTLNRNDLSVRTEDPGGVGIPLRRLRT